MYSVKHHYNRVYVEPWVEPETTAGGGLGRAVEALHPGEDELRPDPGRERALVPGHPADHRRRLRVREGAGLHDQDPGRHVPERGALDFWEDHGGSDCAIDFQLAFSNALLSKRWF